MQLPRWIPRRGDGAGLVLVAVVAAAGMELTRALPRSPLISDVLVAMLLGALVRNSALGRALGLSGSRASTAEAVASVDRFAAGVAFACQWLLRLAIVLLGLKVETSVMGGQELLLVLAVCAVTIPSAFFVAHTLGARLGLPRPLVDVLGAGSMICGASAVNASAPIVGASRQQQGLAVGVVFLSSVAAMFTFRAIAHGVGLPEHAAGLWAGLAVNDLSSAVAVGAQMGDHGGVMAAAAKSTRILMLAPVLVALALLRRSPTGAAAVAAATEQTSSPPTEVTLRHSIVAALPRFILGYVALALARAAGDRVFGDAAGWRDVLAGNQLVVEALMAMVSAGIGLSLALRALVVGSTGAVLTSAGASAFMAAFSLALLLAFEHGGAALAAPLGIAGLLLTFAGYRLAPRRRRQ